MDFLDYWDTRIDKHEKLFNVNPGLANFAFSECQELFEVMEKERLKQKACITEDLYDLADCFCLEYHECVDALDKLDITKKALQNITSIRLAARELESPWCPAAGDAVRIAKETLNKLEYRNV